MDLNFEEFLKSSKESCKTKLEFVTRIEREEAAAKAINIENFLERDHYLLRLSNAKFCVEHGTIKEKDDHNSQLINLIDRLK